MSSSVQQNEIISSPTKAGVVETGTRYVPPHERRRLQEVREREDREREQHITPPIRANDRPPLLASISSGKLGVGGGRNFTPTNFTTGAGGGRPLLAAVGRPWSSTTTLGSSGGISKWKDGPTLGKDQYGPDGLCAQNIRLEEDLFSEKNSGINFEKYDDIPIEVDDYEKHEQIEHFTDIDLGAVINHNLKLAHFDAPTPIQKASIPIVIKKRDLMACAQTGSGKTAAFLFPLISLLLKEGVAPPPRGHPRERKVSPECLILAPTRELAIQIHLQARKFTYRSHIKAVVVYGGADFRSQAYDLEQGCNILVATPGRLLDMTDRGKLSLGSLKFLCIDEADRMLDMGFEPQIRKIVENCPGVNDRQTLMFSATFPKEIQKLAQDFLKDFVFLRVGRVGSTTDYITQRILYVEDSEKKALLLDCLASVDGLTLVFVETKRLADHLEEYLYNQSYSVISIHGDRSQKERETALDAFRSGQARILVATDVAARGLDVKDVKHVVNYDLPHDVNDYVHRIGRTGRCGAQGIATAFFNEKNKNLVRELVELLEESGQEVEPWLYQYANPTPFSRGGGAQRNNNNNNTKRGGGGGGRGTSGGSSRWGRGGGRSEYNSRSSFGSNFGSGSGSFNSSSGPSYSSTGGGSSYHVSNDTYEGGSDNWW